MSSPCDQKFQIPLDTDENDSRKAVALVLWKLQERVKELTALQQVAHILQTDRGPASEVLQQIVDLLPQAWQYPEITSARLIYGHFTVQAKNFAPGKATQSASFKTTSGKEGFLEIIYLEDRPDADEGPFLHEERSLINSVVQIVQAYLDRRLYRRALQKSNQRLERQVAARTLQLEQINQSLKAEIREREQDRRKIRRNRKDLQKLVSELSRTEERERRAIAADLHDHLGQALAILQMKTLELHGEAMFYGLEGRVEELSGLLKKIIKYTRTLTAEICPPVLYELGFAHAVEWLSERFLEKYSLHIRLNQSGVPVRLADDLEGALFKATRELLTNIVKHAQTSEAVIELQWLSSSLKLQVSDEGKGFNPVSVKKRLVKENCFGLFSLQERIRFAGGTMKIDAQKGKGTSVQITIPVVAKGKTIG